MGCTGCIYKHDFRLFYRKEYCDWPLQVRLYNGIQYQAAIVGSSYGVLVGLAS